jgi:hypothetical protein
MTISKKEYYVIFLAFITLILLVIIYNWINYLSNNNYINYEKNNIEGFNSTYISDGHVGASKTTNNVDLPLTTSFSCKNMCGPTARCSITGHQCLSDMDCPGCQPNIPDSKPYKKYVSPENDAGKLTSGVTPTYSSLTTDIGTQAKLFNSKTNITTPKLSNGVNTWMSNFNKGSKLFDSKFVPPQSTYMPVYNKKYSATGEFMDIGPIASNDYLI